MYKALAVSLLLLSSASPYSSAAEELLSSNNQLSLEKKVAATFPFGAADKTSVLSSNGTAQVCVSGNPHCVTVALPPALPHSRATVAGPFVSASMPSWLALSDKAIHLCAITPQAQVAKCVQLGSLQGRELTISVSGNIPELSVSATSLSYDGLKKYAAALALGISAGSKSLKDEFAAASTSLSRSATPGGVTPMEQDVPIEGGDIPVVEVPGVPDYPDPGTGGVVITPIPDIPGPDPADPGPGCGGRAARATFSSNQASNQCPAATPEEMLQRCYQSVENMYDLILIPNCQKWHPLGSQERVQCYSEAMDLVAAEKKRCRERIYGP